MKDKLFKKRNHVNWNDVRRELGDYLVDEMFYCKLGRFDYKKHPSFNRISYWALLAVYGKQVLDAFRATGSYQVFSFRNGVL